MNCPICNVPLLLSEKQGIEIDYCPTCRGVWLDRGELDKIIERTLTRTEINNSQREFSIYDRNMHDDEHFDDYKHANKYQNKHRKRNWLSELFD